MTTVVVRSSTQSRNARTRARRKARREARLEKHRMDVLYEEASVLPNTVEAHARGLSRDVVPAPKVVPKPAVPLMQRVWSVLF